MYYLWFLKLINGFVFIQFLQNMKVRLDALTILVTGTNRGLGKQLSKQLLDTLPNAKLLFTTRKSAEEIKQQLPQIFQKYPKSNFSFKKLDLTSQQSIDKFVEEVKQQKWSFDAIINNAALGCDYGTKVPQQSYAKALLYTNVVGTIRLTNLLLPSLKQNGRIINVSSKLGGLYLHTKQVVEEFSDPELEQQQIFTAVQQYIALCGEGDVGKWSKSAYATSKMFLNAWSRFVLKRKLKLNQVSIAMSPGHCFTDMGGPTATHTAYQGAQSIYNCLFLQNPQFQIFYHRQNPRQYINCG